jgi:hypothetical protein
MTVEFGQQSPRSGVIPITEGNLAVMAFSYAVKLTNDAGQAGQFYIAIRPLSKVTCRVQLGVPEQPVEESEPKSPGTHFLPLHRHECNESSIGGS